MSQEASSRAISPAGASVAAALFLLALVLLLDPLPFHDPAAEPAIVPGWATDASPVRRPLLEPQYQAGVFRYQCNECHGILPPPAATGVREATQHREITLEHGINTWCLSCHHPADRNAFVDDRGQTIPWNQPQRLCAKCHGTVYRDWQHGSHGRTNGYWDTTRGEQTRRKCIECHDPHQPPFPPMHPAPGPHTLRMGPQEDGGHAGPHNPLRPAGGRTAGKAATLAIEEDD